MKNGFKKRQILSASLYIYIFRALKACGENFEQFNCRLENTTKLNLGI